MTSLTKKDKVLFDTLNNLKIDKVLTFDQVNAVWMGYCEGMNYD